MVFHVLWLALAQVPLSSAASPLPVCGLPAAASEQLSPGAPQELERALMRRLLSSLGPGASLRQRPDWFATGEHSPSLTPRGCQAARELLGLRDVSSPAAVRPDPERRGGWELSAIAGLSLEEHGRFFDGSRAPRGLVDAPASYGSAPNAGVRAAPRATLARVPGRLFIRGRADSRAVDPRDIKQGKLGDCYFMAALAAIANADPGIIRRMIRRNEDGSYSVTFHQRRGPWNLLMPEFFEKTVQVHAEFPMQKGKAVFARPGDKSGGRRELWTMVVEKAYAKLHGSYDSIDGGFIETALEEIGGVEPRVYDGADVSIEQLTEWSAKGEAVVVGTPLDWRRLLWPSAKTIWTRPAYKKQHFVSSHSYWLRNVDTKKRTVTLVNPWGWHFKHVTLTEAEFRRAIDSVYVSPLGR